jgi:hypothetical protein
MADGKPSVDFVSDLRSALGAGTELAARWFNAHSTSRTRETWDARGAMKGDPSGVVYAFFDQDGTALYVGESRTTVKERARIRTSCHQKRAWWKNWTTMRFLPVSDHTDRLTLELLLILAWAPANNTKPGARVIATMFASAG